MFLKSLPGISYSTQKGYLPEGFCPGGWHGEFCPGSFCPRGLRPDTNFSTVHGCPFNQKNQ